MTVRPSGFVARAAGPAGRRRRLRLERAGGDPSALDPALGTGGRTGAFVGEITTAIDDSRAAARSRHGRFDGRSK